MGLCSIIYIPELVYKTDYQAQPVSWRRGFDVIKSFEGNPNGGNKKSLNLLSERHLLELT